VLLVCKARAGTIFDFESNTVPTSTTFTDTVGSLIATFAGPATVCASGGLFASLTGNVLIQSFCAPNNVGPLTISFNSNITSLSLDFATSGGPASLSLAAFENGTPVGTNNSVSSDPLGYFDGEGVASFTGLFNSVTLTSSDFIAIDNVSVSAVPEPASTGMLLAALALLSALVWNRRLAVR